MKKRIHYFIGITFALILGLSCTKDEQQVLIRPVVKITNVEIQKNGSVLVEGEITDPGKFDGAAILDAGFCYELKDYDFQISDNQIRQFPNSYQFSGAYSIIAFDHSKSYRIAAWATNQRTYGKSDDIIIDSIFWNAEPVCDVAENSYNADGNVGVYSSVTNMGGDNYRANNGTEKFYIDFQDDIEEGVYITHDFSTGANTVDCKVEYGGVQYYINDFATVFVEKTGVSSHRVTICEARYWINYNQGIYGYYTGSFIIP